MTDNPISINQKAVGRVTIAAFPDYNMMVWNGTDSAHTLNMSQCPKGSAAFPSYSTVFSGYSATGSTAGAQNSLINGPCFVVAPDQTQGYVVGVNQTGTVVAYPTKVEPVGGNPNFWGLVTGWRTVTGSKAAGAPAAAMALQNGQLVLNVVWQDAGAGEMVLAQMQVGDAQETLSFKPLGQSCIGQPSLVMFGDISFLAWTGTDAKQSFNLAIDPTGGVDFQFDGHYIDSNLSSVYGPCLIPVSRTQLYVLWATPAGIQYAQLAENQFGQWGLNSADGCFGIVPVTGTMLGGPYGHRDDGTDENGQTFPALALIWPQSDGTIYTTNVEVSLAPVPITQVELA